MAERQLIGRVTKGLLIPMSFNGAALRKAVLGCLILGFGIQVLPTKYTSVAQILPVEPKKGGASLGDRIQGSAAALGFLGVEVGGAGQATSYVDILGSRWVLERILDTEVTYRKPSRLSFLPPTTVRGTIRSYFHKSDPDSSVKALLSVYKVKMDFKSQTISLEATTRSPELSKQIVDAAASLLDEFIQKNARTKSKEKARMAEIQYGHSKEMLAKAEENFTRFAQANVGFAQSSNPFVRVTGTRLAGEMEMWRQINHQLLMMEQMALMDSQDDVPIINVLDSGNLPSKPSSPSRWLVFAGMIALWVGSSWVVPNWGTVRSLFASNSES